MKIDHLKINHLVNPVGNQLDHPTVSYVVEDTKAFFQKSAEILVASDKDFADIVYDSKEREDIRGIAFELPAVFAPETKYYWKVIASTDLGERAESEKAWFITPKNTAWTAEWITPCAAAETQVIMYKTVDVKKAVKKAIMSMVGLGLYEFYLNGEKQGEECLLPGFCAYDAWIPFQTFPVSLQFGKNNIEVMLGDGWYKGWYGLRKTENNYGDRLALIAELHIWYEDGTEEIVGTDPTWKAKNSPVTYSGIYPGEIFEPGIDTEKIYDTEIIRLDKNKLQPRLDPPITVHERIRPIEVIHTPAGETVLDMGQNMVGWLQFHCKAPRGTKIRFQFGEILQGGNFYNGNLRTAKAEFIYISDGTEREVRQHFTFYGYRYVKITGWEGEPNLEDFRGLVIHSDMEELGSIETSNDLVNRLFLNAKWGQKGNFLDVPTDCPQRDERYGWTGDAQIFSGTACYNADTYAFYTKYGYDISCEQKKFAGGVPDVVPVANNECTVSTAWGEAGTVIPWNVYLHYGDKGILRRQYESMKKWVDYMKTQDDKYGSKRLWQSGFHYGDWLALDGNVKGGVYGGTDLFLIASGYYYYSTNILRKTAEILGKKEDAKYYGKLAEEIKEAFVKEYFSPKGRLCVDTMTAYVVVLYMGLTPDFAYEQTKKGLFEKLRRNRYHLETGFVGTPYLCRVLSDNGMNDMAYHLLLEKGYPGWLYEVLMGATTVWERWNSVLPDGRISGTEMNSLNHYAYGSIAEWMYRDMVGILPSEENPGFQKFILSPKPNYQIPWAKGQLRSASGVIRSAYEIHEDKLTVTVTVPFNTRAVLILPDAELSDLKVPNQPGLEKMTQEGNTVHVELKAGEYQFTYNPTIPYRKIYSLDSPMEELNENPKTKAILDETFYKIHKVLPFEKELYTLREMLNGPFTNLPYTEQAEIDRRLREVK